MDVRKFFNSGRTTAEINDDSVAGRSDEVSSVSSASVAPEPPAVTEDLDTNGTQLLSDAGEEEEGSATFGVQPSDLGTELPMQHEMLQPYTYPLTAFGRKLRRFNAGWFSGRPWLEYSIERDAVFCFPCHKMRGFLTTRQAKPDNAFTVLGYRNWKKGLGNHESSYAHRMAMMLWNEFKDRQDRGKEISTIVNYEQLQRNRY